MAARGSARRRLLVSVLAFSLFGAGVSAYLTFAHASGSSIACLGTGGCEAVRQSAYSSLGGVPVAALGLVVYAIIAASAGLGVFGPQGVAVAAFLVQLGIATAGAAFSVYLTVMSGLAIGSFCPWCLASAAAMLAIFAISLVLAVRGYVAPDAHWQGSAEPGH